MDQLRQFDRTRPSKRVSNAEWVSPADPEARIARMKDGRTRLAYNANARGDLQAAASNLEPLDLAPSPEAPAEVVAEKGYHRREVIKRLDDGP